MSSDRNRGEQRAARALMASQGISYTQALRQLREQPGQLQLDGSPAATVERTGSCIVCSAQTPDRTQSGGRKHWRCKDWTACMLRRNAGRARPRATWPLLLQAISDGKCTHERALLLEHHPELWQPQ